MPPPGAEAGRAVDARAFLRKKRDGGVHSSSDVRAFVDAYVRGEIPDYQVSAWLMAAMLRGLSAPETEALTRAMIDSGRSFDWSSLGRPTADKHSTGGIGDKVSLILAPLAAACGLAVPMVSGRGLGHTGGTLDKLEAIPGFRTRLTTEAMAAQLERLGVVMVGQGPDLAPADGKLYALRDVTATVEYIPFIVSSIVSKKVAEGAGVLIYDVKCGNGAFMKTSPDAHELARQLVETTRGLGRVATALVTDMSQPLGAAVGNALEVGEAIEVLHGHGPQDVRALTLDLVALMLRGAGLPGELPAARQRAERALDTGEAWAMFTRLVEAQGGDVHTVEEPARLPRAPVTREVQSRAAGRLTAIDSFGLGEWVVAIGGGRRTKEDAIDPRVGITVHRRIGDPVHPGDALVTLHLAAPRPDAEAGVAACFRIEEREVERPELVLERVD